MKIWDWLKVKPNLTNGIYRVLQFQNLRWEHCMTFMLMTWKITSIFSPYSGFHKRGPNSLWPLMLTQQEAKPCFPIFFLYYGGNWFFWPKVAMAQWPPPKYAKINFSESVLVCQKQLNKFKRLKSVFKWWKTSDFILSLCYLVGCLHPKSIVVYMWIFDIWYRKSRDKLSSRIPR